MSDSSDDQDWDRLVNAAEEGHADTVSRILESSSPELINDQTQDSGMTVLMFAAAYGHANVVQLILDSPKVSPDMVNMKDHSGMTALMFPAAYGHANVVQLILNHSREIMTAKNDSGHTALILAAANNHSNVVDILWESYPITDNHDRTALMFAANFGHAGIVRELLSLLPKQAVNAADAFGCTALMYAAEEGHVDTVREFLASDKVDRTIQNVRGSTAAGMAFHNLHFGIANMLDPSILSLLLFPFLLS